MAVGAKLINKMMRLERLIRRFLPSYEKVDKRQEVMYDSLGPYNLMRGIERRFDADFGTDMLQKDQKLSAGSLAASGSINATTLERFDFDPGAGTDFGMKITLASGLIEAIGMRAGDQVEMLEQSLAGQMLQVVSIESSTEVRLEDVSSFGSAESNVSMRYDLSTEQPAAV